MQNEFLPVKKLRKFPRVVALSKRFNAAKLLLLALPVLAVPGLQAKDARYQHPSTTLIANAVSEQSLSAAGQRKETQKNKGINSAQLKATRVDDDENDSSAISPPNYVTHIAPSVFARLGAHSHQRIENWLNFLADNQHKADRAKLEAVNDYFNKFDYIEDNLAWKKTDYWATPLEVVIRHGGDCEDLAIAKYFTLRALKVSSDKMRLTFVKNFHAQQSHMVLDYYLSETTKDPLVLDNMQAKIHVRNDLRAIYSFNEETVWEGRRQDSNLGSPLQIERWRSLQNRLHNQHGS
jgi:predicted transglutaminase-like cysteine proteinase